MDERLQKSAKRMTKLGANNPWWYPPLPAWETLSIELREAFVHVYYRGRFDAISSDEEPE
jgi:hypothetical protein